MDLEGRLAAARARVAAAVKALAPRHKGGEMEEYRAAQAALLVAERELAESKGEEHAVPIDFPVQWDAGAPLPQLLVNDSRALLIFLVTERGSLALVEFSRCVSAKLGSPNDEVFRGHPLAGKGLEGYTAQLVRNSRWLAEIEQINSVHAGYRPEAWKKRNHYVLWFHDTTFECIAEGFAVEVRECSMSELLAEACRRLIA